jgi:acetyl esterase/lipase
MAGVYRGKNLYRTPARRKRWVGTAGSAATHATLTLSASSGVPIASIAIVKSSVLTLSAVGTPVATLSRAVQKIFSTIPPAKAVADTETTTNDITTYDGTHSIDVYKPDSATNAPVLVLAHGGAWTSNDKSIMVSYAEGLSELGFVVFAIDFTNEGPGVDAQIDRQTMIDDYANAIVWARANASTYGGNGKKVAAFGISSGGHLALMVACTKTGDSKPNAVLAYSPPTRLSTLVDVGAGAAKAYLDDAAPSQALYDQFSPYAQVTSACPPIRIVGSANESTTGGGVRRDQYDDMYAASIAAGVNATEVIYTGSTHANFTGVDKAQAAIWLNYILVDGASMVRSPSKIFSVSSTPISSFIKTISKTFAVIGQGSSVLIRSPLKTFLVIGQGSASKIVTGNKIFSVTGNPVAIIVRNPSKILAAIGQGSTNISIVKISLLTLSAVGQGSASIIKRAILSLSISAAIMSSLLKNAAKTFFATGQGSSTTVKTNLKNLFATGIGSAEIRFVALKNFSITALSDISLNKNLIKNLSAVGNGLAEINKFPAITFVAIGQGSAIVDLIKQALVIRGFFTAMIRREGYFRAYITKASSRPRIK